MEEEHYKLVNTMNRELGEIKGQIQNLNDKIEENHQVHIDNREDIKKILEQTIKTNGRVLALEKVNQDRDKEIGKEKDGWRGIKFNLLEKVSWLILGAITFNLNHFYEYIKNQF